MSPKQKQTKQTEKTNKQMKKQKLKGSFEEKAIVQQWLYTGRENLSPDFVLAMVGGLGAD